VAVVSDVAVSPVVVAPPWAVAASPVVVISRWVVAASTAVVVVPTVVTSRWVAAAVPTVAAAGAGDKACCGHCLVLQRYFDEMFGSLGQAFQPALTIMALCENLVVVLTAMNNIAFHPRA